MRILDFSDGFSTPTPPTGGIVYSSDGTVSLPGQTWALDTDTGFYRIGSGNVGFSANGVTCGQFGANGNWAFGSGVALNNQSLVYIKGSNLSGSTAGYGINLDTTIPSTFTSGLETLYVRGQTDAAAYTASYVIGISAAAHIAGAGSTITRAVGVFHTAQTVGGTGNAMIADNLSFSGGWFINSTYTGSTLLSGDTSIRGAGVGTARILTVSHSDNTSDNSRAIIRAQGGGNSGGDPVVSWYVDGSTEFMAGIDVSSSRSWKLSGSGALGTSDFLVCTTAGAFQMNGPLSVKNGSGADITALNLFAGTTTGTVRNYWRNSDSSRGFEVDADFTGGSEMLILQSDNALLGLITRAGAWTIGGNGVTPTHRINCQNQGTVGGAGGASALPATPSGYLVFALNGTTEYAIPYYPKS